MKGTIQFFAAFSVLALPLVAAAGPIAGGTFCGGIAGIPCPAGQTCVDNPADACSPVCGGADCGGICVEIAPAACGGFAGIPCPVGATCLDAEGDACSPVCGGADCMGRCYFVPPKPAFCGGIAGFTCVAGLTCVDNPKDECSPDCGGADCGGLCVTPAPAFCGVIAGQPCPAGQTCIDDPRDRCDPACGGADCGGICVTLAVSACGGAGACRSDADCGAGTWCRASMDGGSCCVPFVGPGESCEGFTLPWLFERCQPGLLCVHPEPTGDIPGVCATCDYQGTPYQEGDSFPAGDGCNTCSCSAGNVVTCTKIACEKKCEDNADCGSGRFASRTNATRSMASARCAPKSAAGSTSPCAAAMA